MCLKVRHILFYFNSILTYKLKYMKISLIGQYKWDADFVGLIDAWFELMLCCLLKSRMFSWNRSSCNHFVLLEEQFTNLWNNKLGCMHCLQHNTLCGTLLVFFHWSRCTHLSNDFILLMLSCVKEWVLYLRITFKTV